MAAAGLVLAAAVVFGLLEPHAPIDPAARVIIESTPPGLSVAIDGKPLADPTPVTLDLAPGTHLVTLSGDGESLWSHSFEVEADTRYILHPIIPR